MIYTVEKNERPILGYCDGKPITDPANPLLLALEITPELEAKLREIDTHSWMDLRP